MTATWKLILGPPGTGKTETCIRIVEQALTTGIEAHRIAFVTFAKAAAVEARTRAEAACAHEVPRFVWFRTIHSMAFKLRGLDHGQVMAREHWLEFARAYGYRFTPPSAAHSEGLAPPALHTQDDQVRALHDWARNTCRSVQQALAVSPLRVSASALGKYIARFEGYKHDKGVVDYIDMIEGALDEQPPNVRIAVIDEAQDLSPLQIRAVRAWFVGCERVYVAGDDDQSIFGFQGADPTWLVSLANTAGVEMEVLKHSKRVPRASHAYAQAIITRNKQRVPKEYLPRDADGVVAHLPLESALRTIDTARSAFLLVRNRCFADDVVTQLRRFDVPYTTTMPGGGALDPEHGVVRAVRAALGLLRGVPLMVGDLLALVRRVPCRKSDLLPHGLKSALERLPRGNVLTPADVSRLLGAGRLVSVLALHGVAAVLVGADADDAKYVERVFAKHGTDVTPKLEVTTIHAAKGRQADQVILLADQTRTTFEDSLDVRRGGREAETRVAYVAATRSFDRLIVVPPQTGRAYPYPRA